MSDDKLTDTLRNRNRIAALLELLRPITPREDADAVIDAVQFLVDGIIDGRLRGDTLGQWR